MSLTENELITRKMYEQKAEEWLEKSRGRNRECFWREEMGDLVSFLAKARKDQELRVPIG